MHSFLSRKVSHLFDTREENLRFVMQFAQICLREDEITRAEDLERRLVAPVHLPLDRFDVIVNEPTIPS